MNLLDADSALPALKSKTKPPAASGSAVTPAEVSTLRTVQANLLAVSSGPSPPAPAALSPDHTELPSADTNDPQAADFKAHLVRKDTAESEVIHLLFILHVDMLGVTVVRKQDHYRPEQRTNVW